MRVLVFVALAALSCACSKSPRNGNEAAPGPAPTTPAKPGEPRRIPIELGERGFVPDKIPVKPGEEVTLVVTRTNPGECVQAIQIPSKNLKKDLPVNQPVEIPFKAPNKPGDVKIACGMDMLQGVIEVRP